MKIAQEMLHEKGGDVISVSPDTTLHDALTKMVKKNIGSMLVKDDSKIVGIWTERDLMKSSVKPGFDPKTAKIKDHMTKSLVSTPHNATVYNLQDKLVGKRLRHLLVEKDGEYIGILSAGDVMRATLDEKDNELQELNAKVSWDYYEDWRWKTRKKN